MKIQEINMQELSIIFDMSEARKEGLIFSNTTKLFLCTIKNEKIGFFGIIWHKKKATIKNIYIAHEYRKKGHFKSMFLWFDSLCYGFDIEATCTSMSINGFLKNGFQVVQVYRNGCKKVRREDIPGKRRF